MAVPSPTPPHPTSPPPPLISSPAATTSPSLFTPSPTATVPCLSAPYPTYPVGAQTGRKKAQGWSRETPPTSKSTSAPTSSFREALLSRVATSIASLRPINLCPLIFMEDASTASCRVIRQHFASPARGASSTTQQGISPTSTWSPTLVVPPLLPPDVAPCLDPISCEDAAYSCFRQPSGDLIGCFCWR